MMNRKQSRSQKQSRSVAARGWLEERESSKIGESTRQRCKAPIVYSKQNLSTLIKCPRVTINILSFNFSEKANFNYFTTKNKQNFREKLEREKQVYYVGNRDYFMHLCLSLNSPSYVYQLSADSSLYVQNSSRIFLKDKINQSKKIQGVLWGNVFLMHWYRSVSCNYNAGYFRRSVFTFHLWRV